MAWVKYDKDGLVNLDKIVDINIRTIHTVNDNYVWTINFYATQEHRYPSKTYKSFEECMRVFNNLTRQLASNAQYIDITDS